MLVAYTCGLKTKNLSNNNHTTREYETISMNATHTKGEMLDYKTAALKKSYQITHLEKLRSKSSNHDS